MDTEGSAPQPQPEPQRRHLFAVGPSDAVPSMPRADLPADPLPGYVADERLPRGPLEALAERVGGVHALMTLDVSPLPDEPFDWSGVLPRDREVATEVLALSDAFCDELLDVEYRTIARRILARVAARDPRPLRRGRAARLAAALVWLTGRGNDEFGRRSRRSCEQLWRWFDVSPAASRGHALRTAAGLDDDGWSFAWSRDGAICLGHPSVLHSRVRLRLAASREAILDAERRTWRPLGDGRTAEIRGVAATPVVAAKGIVPGTGRAGVVLGFGDELEDAAYFMLTIPDAYELARMLERALAQPLPAAGR